MECLKAIFFLTSCQPNWNIIFQLPLINHFSKFYSRPDVYHVFFFALYSHNSGMTRSQLELDWICNVIPVLSSHCNFGGVTFFTVTTIIRFYMMLVQKSLPTARRMSQHDFAIGGVIIASTFAWIFGWTGRIYLITQFWLDYWPIFLYH